jgi:hypothetical protein
VKVIVAISLFVFLLVCCVASAGELPSAPTPLRADDHQRFFDFRNSLAIAGFGLSLTGDALSTQRLLGFSGYKEMNPLARPFVQSRSGAAAYSAASFGMLVGGMYLAHKTHHHKLERILPFAMTASESFLTYWNYHLLPQAKATHYELRQQKK